MYKKILRVLLCRPTLVILLLLMQFALLFFMFTSQGIFASAQATGLVSVILRILSIVTVMAVVARREKAGYKILWIVMILLFPLFGCVLYLLFGFQASARRLNKRYRLIERPDALLRDQDSEVMSRLIRQCPASEASCRYLSGTGGFPVYENTAVSYFPTVEEMYARMLEELARAKSFIFIEVFILDEGVMWDGIRAILKEKVKEGVDVRLIYDDIGCMYKLPAHYERTLEADGIRCAVFNPFRPLLTSAHNHRDHRKMIIIDGRFAFTGGANIADEYINRVERFGHWKDGGTLLEGDAVRSFTLFFLNMWAFIGKKNEDVGAYLLRDPQTVPGAGGFVQPYCDSPTDTENVGEHVYLQMISSARQYLYITTPYLILDDGMLSALTLAAKSGVDVRIITPHIPDKKPVHAATRSYYEPLLLAGARIYEYTPGFIHAKIFVSDDRQATVGTVNLDYRSLYLHFECGVRLYDSPVIEAVKADFLATMAQCEEITMQKIRQNPLSKFVQIVMRLWAPFM